MSFNAEPASFAIGTFAIAGGPSFPGIVIADKVLALHALVPLCAKLGRPLPNYLGLFEVLQDWPVALSAMQAAAAELERQQPDTLDLRNTFVAVEHLQVLAPLDRPRQVICAGANYFRHVVDLLVAAGPGDTPETQGMSPEQLRDYATQLMKTRAEQGAPYTFSKPVACITGPYDPVVLPPHAQKPDWELELAVVIGKKARHVHRDQALSHVAAYAIANDITNRDQIWRRDDMKAMGTDWIAAKSSPTYLPLGPYLVPACFVEDPQQLRLTLKLNGEVKQDEHTSDMIFGVARLIEYISSLVELHPGDIICTGSPAGNGAAYNRFLRPGDVIESTISGLGMQRNPCIKEEN